MENHKKFACNEKRIDFTATIKIPAGFVITSLKNYSIDLLLDKSNLYEIDVTNIRSSYINLQGSIEYNVVAREFKPAKLMQGSPVTAFTAHDTLVVDMNLGYRCYEDLIPNDLFNRFASRVIKHTEFVIDETGQKIPYSRKCPYSFFDALSSACCTQVINIPYTLIIRPRILMNQMDTRNRGVEEIRWI